MAKPFTKKADDKMDKKAGIKEGTKKDLALDKKRGLPAYNKGGMVKKGKC